MNSFTYYAKCLQCDYSEDADSLQDAREKCEAHEKEKHKKKLVGRFGKKVIDKSKQG